MEENSKKKKIITVVIIVILTIALLLTIPTGKPVGFLLASIAHNRTSFSDFGI